jgi:bifunctional DNase/RNase
MKCETPDCEGKAVFHLTWIENRACMRQQHLCLPHGRAEMHRGVRIERGSRFTGPRGNLEHASQFEIAFIVISEVDDRQAVFLSEVDGTRQFSIVIGTFEATSLDRKLKSYRSPRPQTHNAFADCIRLLGGDLQYVLVHHLEGQTYYTDGLIRANGRLLVLDMRPSDAFNLALEFGRPIFFAEQVLERIAQSSDASG